MTFDIRTRLVMYGAKYGISAHVLWNMTAEEFAQAVAEWHRKRAS